MHRLEDVIVDTDVLVVGAGAAGCWAALRAKDFSPRVTLVDKGILARSGDAVFCHDMLAPLPEDQLEVWLREAVEQTEYLSDQRYAEILFKENGQRIEDLQKLGVPFEKDKKGELFLSLGRGHKESRVVLCDCRKLMEVLRDEVLLRGVNIVERVMVFDLLTSDGRHPTEARVVGALGVHTRTGKLITFNCEAVVLCTGVITPKLHLAYADNLTGDGQAMAFRTGAELSDLEFNLKPMFVGFHRRRVIPTNLMPFQTQGAYIVNRYGERFMERYVPVRKERRATFGLLALATVKEAMEGRGPVYFDMRHFDLEKLQQLRRILPLRMAFLAEANIDVSKELLECKTIIQFLGGENIRVNLNGETNVPGLLAAGIATQFAGWTEGLSGARLAICNVFGYRAGERAARVAHEGRGNKVDPGQVERLNKEFFAPLGRHKGLMPQQVYSRLNRRILQPQYSVTKDEVTIKEMIEEMKSVASEDLQRVSASDVHELIKANEARNFVLLLELIYMASLERKESRLGHYRQDFPFRDDIDWLKWVVTKRERDRIVVRYEPVPTETNRVGPLSRLRVPSPVQFSRYGSSGG